MSIFERDWVMRLVRQMAELLARALKLKQAGKHDEAAEALEAGCLSLFGIDWRTLAWADSASTAALLKEPAKIRAFAQLIEERALLHEAKSEAAEAGSKWQHAYELYCEAHATEEAKRLEPKIDLARVPAKYR